LPKGVVQLKSQIVQLVDHPVERRPVLLPNLDDMLVPSPIENVHVMLVRVSFPDIPMIVVIAEELAHLPIWHRPQGLVGVAHRTDFMPPASEARFEHFIDGNAVAAEKVQPAPDRGAAPALLDASLKRIFDEEAHAFPVGEIPLMCLQVVVEAVSAVRVSAPSGSSAGYAARSPRGAATGGHPA